VTDGVGRRTVRFLSKKDSFSLFVFGATTFGIMALSITALGVTVKNMILGIYETLHIATFSLIKQPSITLNTMTLGLMMLSIMALGMMTLSILALTVTIKNVIVGIDDTQHIVTLSIRAPRIKTTQHDTEHNDTQHYNT
jgi:hypothetical protein